nr:ABC transporter permease [Thalassobacillus sp. CUG 92003]
MGILAIGMTLVIITGGIDVSVAAVTTAVTVFVGFLMMNLPDNFLSVVIIFIAAPLFGMLLGSINGFFVAKIKIPAIVVTLGTLSIFNGGIIYLTSGQYTNSTNFPQVFMDFSNLDIFGISILVYILFAVALCTGYILKYTTIGRSVFAIGGNQQSAVRVGINQDRVQLFVFAFMGFLAGIAAIVQIAYTKAIDPNGLAGLELTVIAAVVLGGANLMGGRGSIKGTLLGVLLLAITENGLILARIDTFWQRVVVGLIILIAVSYDAIQNKRAERKRSTIEVEDEQEAS